MTALAETPVRRPSRTRVRLGRLLAGLLVAALITLTTSVIAVTRVFDTAATVRDHTTQAVLEVAAARAALAEADQAAIDSFRTGNARLAGETSPCVRHMHRRCFVAHMHEVELGLERRIEDRHDVIAREREHMLAAQPSERLRNDVGASHRLGHRACHCGSYLASRSSAAPRATSASM